MGSIPNPPEPHHAEGGDPSPPSREEVLEKLEERTLRGRLAREGLEPPEGIPLEEMREMLREKILKASKTFSELSEKERRVLCDQATSDHIPPWQYLSDEQLRDMCSEVGISDLSPEPPLTNSEDANLRRLHKLGYPKNAEQEEGLKVLICPLTPSCTDLLVDPTDVLRDKKRWPSHLCPERFLWPSTIRWVEESGTVLSTTELTQWRTQWPLPIGKQALGLETFGWEVYNLMPFDGQEKALWAIRVNAADCTLDLFGLDDSHGQRGEQAYATGEFRSILRGSGTSLSDLRSFAKRWWGELCEKQMTGRPAGSGTWASTMDYWVSLRAAIRKARAARLKLTQDNVADCFDGKYDARQLRRDLDKYRISWTEAKKIP